MTKLEDEKNRTDGSTCFSAGRSFLPEKNEQVGREVTAYINDNCYEPVKAISARSDSHQCSYHPVQTQLYKQLQFTDYRKHVYLPSSVGVLEGDS